MMTRKLRYVYASVAVAALALTGCSAGADDSTDAGGSGGGTSDGASIGLVMLQGDEYFSNIQKGMEEAVKADGGTVTPSNSNNDAGAEVSAVQNLIQSQVDAIILQPVSSEGSIATMKSVREAKIPLICYGNCAGDALSPDIVSGVVQSDNTALGTATGEAAASYILENLDGEANIGILNCDAAAETCKLRKAGFKKALEDAGVKANYVADQEGYLADKATPVATNMLSANPEINLLWSANEGGTVGLVTAVKQAGKDTPVFGTDISEQLAGFLLDEDNILQATTGQDPITTAQEAYKQALKAIDGGTNEPFELLVPGITYDRSKPDAINSYLGK